MLALLSISERRFNISIPREARRGPGFGSPDPDAPENHQYVKGQRIYPRSCKPLELATLVIDNNDLENPFESKRTM
jgi:uridine kinase